MENLLMTLTNLYALRAIYTAYNNKYYFASIIITLTCLASIVYHLSETKHGMNSLCLTKYSDITLNIDRFLATIVGWTILWNFRHKINIELFVYDIISLIAQGLSESQHVIHLPLKTEKILYLNTHPVWHFCAFHCAYLLVK